MSLEGMTSAYMRAALDTLIVAKELQKMIIVIPEG